MNIRKAYSCPPPPPIAGRTKHTAFTLAEVLVTLGIIGIVAALTIPGLIQSYKKHSTVTAIKDFYSTFTNAIKLSETENGEFDTWEFPENRAELEDWYGKYLNKYVKPVKINVLTDGGIILYFPKYYVWVSASTADTKKIWFDLITTKDITNTAHGINKFSFILPNEEFINSNPHIGKGLQPEILPEWDGTREWLTSGSSAYACNNTAVYKGALCIKVIQMDGWEIAKDYPYKF